jgi:CRP-like cAMP-binding protein
VHLDTSAFVADPELVQILEARSAPVVCDRDRVLFLQGEDLGGLYLLHSGSITLSTLSLGNEVSLAFQTNADSLVGLPAVLDRALSRVTAVVRRGAALSFITRSTFDALVQTEPLLLLRLKRALAAEASRCRQAILDRNCIGTDCGESIFDEPIPSCAPASVRRALGMFAAD